MPRLLTQLAIQIGPINAERAENIDASLESIEKVVEEKSDPTEKLLVAAESIGQIDTNIDQDRGDLEQSVLHNMAINCSMKQE